MVIDTKAFLVSYRTAERRLRDIDRRLDELMAQATRTTSSISDVKVQGGSSGSAVEDAAVERVDLMQERADCMIAMRRVDKSITAVKQGSQRDLLRWRYIVGLPWEEIAEKLGMPVRQVISLHGMALQSLDGKR